MRSGLVESVRMVFADPALAQGIYKLVLVPCGGSLAHSMCSVFPARMTGFVRNILRSHHSSH